MGTKTDDLDFIIRRDLADYRHHFRGTDIQTDDQILFHFFRHYAVTPRD